MERYYVGTELKFALTIESEGFSMDDDQWIAKVICGKNEVKCCKLNNSKRGDDGQWYILVDTSKLGSGQCYLVVEIDVPDFDFPDEYRHEVLKQERPLCELMEAQKKYVERHDCCKQHYF